MTPAGCEAGPMHAHSKHMAEDAVSERLRSLTRNPMGSARRGSDPLGVEFSMLCQGCWASGSLSLSQEGDSELKSLLEQCVSVGQQLAGATLRLKPYDTCRIWAHAVCTSGT